MELKQICVIGAGDMGHGIAEVCAIGGYTIKLYDIKQEMLDSALKRILKSLKVLKRKRKIRKESLDQILQRIEPTLDIGSAVSDSMLIFEAAPEIKDLKRELYQKIQPFLREDAVIATNTSYLSINSLSQDLENPDRFIGCHFFNPVVLQKVVELNYTPKTSEDTLLLLEEVMENIGKKSVRVKDSPGFVLNRIQIAPQVLVSRLYQQGIIKPEEVDALMKNKGLPLGAFETMDYVGLDVTLHGMKYMGSVLGEEYGPPSWLVELVDQGHLGRKTGRGVYDWSSGHANIDLGAKTDVLDTLDLLITEINEAMKLLEENVVESKKDIDKVMKLGSGNPLSLFGLLKGVGKEKCVARCEHFAELLGFSMFKPVKTLKNWEN